MSFEEEKNLSSSEKGQGCCGGDHGHDHEGCCGGDHGHDHECGCGGDHGHDHECCCGGDHGHDHECGCGGGCGHDHGQKFVTLVMEDNSELQCPVIDIFELSGKSYIALFHPVEEAVLLLRLFEHEDGTIDIGEITDDDEFELVSKTFSALHEE